ncbi:MAG TPA: class I SAM-dependent methyltransferase [Acidimicrobiales bacterium]|nr:class I SAM-dependent methyltransferase [Acidimicrobiales bacterium]
MTTTTTTHPAPAHGSAPETARDTVHETARDGLAERILESLLGAMELLSVEIGLRVGAYRALRDHGPATPPDLARRAGIELRYAREWLEQQATAGIVAVDHDADDPDDRRFALPSGHAEVLLDPESPAALAGAGSQLLGLASAVDAVVEAYRTGGGVPFADYGGDLRHGIGAMNRPAYVHEVDGWLAAIADVHPAIGAARRVIDVGCGVGWSTVALARALPHAEVAGIDLDPASIDEAVVNAAGTEVSDRVRFAVGDGAHLTVDGRRADLVALCEVLHDSAHPVELLRRAREATDPDGVVMVIDERAAEEFGAIGDPVERLLYAYSVTHCLPATMAEDPSHATGTVIRPATVAAYALDAGFGTCREIPIENPLWRCYLLSG